MEHLNENLVQKHEKLNFFKKYQYLLCLTLSAAIVLLDQWVKQLVRAGLKPIGSVSVIKGLLSLQYAENEGAAFSMLIGFRWFFIVVTTIFCIFLIYMLIAGKFNQTGYSLAVAMVLGGGIANLIDRIIFGYVVDYIVISFFPAIFNVGDIFVTIGACVYCICTVIQIIEEKRTSEHESV